MSILEIILYSIIGLGALIWLICIIKKAIEIKKKKQKGLEEDED